MNRTTAVSLLTDPEHRHSHPLLQQAHCYPSSQPWDLEREPISQPQQLVSTPAAQRQYLRHPSRAILSKRKRIVPPTETETDELLHDTFSHRKRARPLSEQDRRHPSLISQHNTSLASLLTSLLHPSPCSGRGPTSSHYIRSPDTTWTMLSNSRDEAGAGIRTVTLPRASLSNGSPPNPRSMSISRMSNDQSNSGHRSMTPDVTEGRSGIQLLRQVGIVELLDQDERPTFIVDLAASANQASGTLRIVFANAAMRSSARLLGLITNKTEIVTSGDASSGKFHEFKAWITGSVHDHESQENCLPSHTYGEITWTCSTLRKRLRLISANFSPILTRHRTTSSSSSPLLTYHNPGVVLDTSRSSPRYPAGSPLAESVSNTIPTDYFAPRLPVEARTTDENQVQTHPFAAKHSPVLFSTPLDGAMRTPDAVLDLAHESPDTVGTMGALADGPSRPIDALTIENIRGVEAASPSEKSSGAGFFDWTRLPMDDSMSEHIKFAKSRDWASTSLGPMEEWPNSLRAMCNLIMASPHPAAMYWGEDLVVIYNEAYITLAGQKHPKLMGSRYMDSWSEIWHEVEEPFRIAQTTGQSTMKDDDRFFLIRAGYVEETYFSWSIIPLIDEDGSVVGLYNPAFEKTRRKIAERRMLTLREVGECTATALELKSFWAQVLKGLEYNGRDAPFVLLYSVSDELESDRSSIHSNSVSGNKQCILEGSFGFPEGHKASSSPLDLNNSPEGFAPHFREAMKSQKPILLQTEDGTLSAELVDGLMRRGYDDPCRAAVICPVLPTTGEAVLGFLVLGINPRRPYDDDYALFIQLLTRQLATSMASVVLFEEEIRRGERAAKLAAIDRIELSQQLAARTQEAIESETKFTRMAELAPVGIFMADADGHITFFNDAWYDISRHPREENNADNWPDSVHEDDAPTVKEQWRRCYTDKVPISVEFRFKAPWEARNGVKGETWVLGAAFPERNEDGNVKSIFGSLTNISEQKWAEDFQKRRMEEAVELKRQQENFIDITSHEMRNPLSAILQCADEISTSLTDARAKSTETGASDLAEGLIDSNIDAAQTIALCAQHQKRIVDDVLTMSKLDSALLLVTPVEVQPVTVVQRALKMFEGELETNEMEMNFELLDSYKELQVDWVKLDPSRLLQVLINLTGNAVKFTQKEEERAITVSMGASLEPPSSQEAFPVSYFQSRLNRDDITTGPDWGDGEVIYLQFSVQDTGRGLTENEKKLLFLRFSQASPRTHVQYGGSGLGLFISRELTELQGGEIGVSSESGKGSLFAFYVQARRAKRPTDLSPDALPLAPSTYARRVNSSDSSTKLGHRRAEKSPQKSPPSTIASGPLSPDRSQFKVLIVEDNLVNQRVLSKQLRNKNCVVYVANHGAEAIDFLQHTTFWARTDALSTLEDEERLDLSLILMDLEMPVMDGLTCARQIRELQESGEIVRHVPIIAVTANARVEQISTAINSGMDDVVSKPFRIRELLPKIEALTKKFPSALHTGPGDEGGAGPSDNALVLPPAVIHATETGTFKPTTSETIGTGLQRENHSAPT